jgi:PAS domain S-box-containing protein
MEEQAKSKKQLINELMLSRQRIHELEKAESEHKQVEQALRTSQERLELALRSSKAGTWDMDVAADRVMWDDQLHALLGMAAGSFSGKQEDFLSLLHPDDRERVRNQINAAAKRGAEYETTYRVILPDSSMRFIADRGNVCRDDTGRAVRMIGVSLDITELKKAEEAQEESWQKLKAIIDFLPGATFVINREGKVIAWNRAIEEMTGFKAVDMLGKGNYEYALPFYGERRPILIDLVLRREEEFEAKYMNIERKGTMLAGETYVSALRGDVAYLLGTASSLCDSKGNLIGAIESILDITEHKQAGEDLRRYADHLEELVTECTARLAEVNEQPHAN